MLTNKLQFSSAFHPRTEGLTKGLNRSLKNLLRCLANDYIKQWDLVLPQAEFAYNSSINRLTWKSPFEIVCGKISNQIIDLVDESNHLQVSDDSIALLKI